MALLGNRIQRAYDLDYYWGSTAAEAGGVAVLGASAGSGVVLDQGVNLARYKVATSSDVAIGLLLNDVVDEDLSKYPADTRSDKVQVNSKVTLGTDGVWYTNLVDNVTISSGELAYASKVNAGNLSNSGDPSCIVGRFGSSKGPDGYVKVNVKLPNTNVNA